MQRKAVEKQQLDVSLSTRREWEIGEKIKLSCGRRVRLPGGGRKKSSEINMRINSYQETGTPRESVQQNDQDNGRTNVRHREWQQRWGVCCQNLEKFVTFSSWIFVRKELNAWSVKWLKKTNTRAIIWCFTFFYFLFFPRKKQPVNSTNSYPK